MDENETKTCENCKREIPSVNFTTHAVHCARNIRMCPVCKEPVPQSELPEHHDKLHKLLPCKQCGESVCGTDLEDHVRDSCAHSMKTCRFCALELRRGELPAHERYCGARTERCEPCGEWVMHKYRQLHLDSNHGFLRLDEDPVPTENAIKTTNVPKPSPSNLNSAKPDLSRPLTATRHFSAADSGPNSSKPRNVSHTSSFKDQNTSIPYISTARNSTSTTKTNGQTADSAQVDGTAASNRNASRQMNGTTANLALRGSPNPVSTTDPCTQSSSGVTNGSSSSHSQSGAVPRPKRSNHQPQVNTSAATILPDKVNKNLWASRGAVKKGPAPAPPARAPPDPRRDRALLSAVQRLQEEEAQRREQTAYNLSVGQPPVLSAAAKLDKLRKMDALQNRDAAEPDYSHVLQGRVWRAPDAAPAGHVLGGAALRDEEAQRRRSSLRNLQPMSAEQFRERCSAAAAGAAGAAGRPDDRFSQIKSSLRELRRGLNEVTAPYNSSVNNDSNHNGALRLPCEFCAALLPPDDLVLHQTGCRPDLAQYRPASRDESRAASRPRSRTASPAPVIPCEFCAAPLSVYLISEHQERCGRDAARLLPD